MSDPYLQPPSPTGPALQPPFPQMPYATPYPGPYGGAYPSASPGAPASIKAIGITGIILGTLTLLNHGLGILLFVNVSAASSQYGSVYKTFQIGNSAAFGTAAAVLLVGSIGCLTRAEWARRLLLFWATVYPFLLATGTGLMVAWVIPNLMAPHATSANDQARIAGTYFGAIFAGVVLLILPICIHVYLRRPYVRAAFQN